jgi:hypothetical protein
MVLGFTAILRRDIPTHRAWMIRGYVGPGGRRSRAVHGRDADAGRLGDQRWVINVVVAEIVIRRTVRRPV